VIILDTNVVSELMKPRPNAAVLEWLTGQSRDSLRTTSITKAEILYGVVRLPDGRRKADLAAETQRMFREDFPEPALAFDDAATPYYAEILGARRRAGRPMTSLDAQIAAIAAANSAAVATRNVSDFDGCGVKVIDPWAAPWSAPG
jgi:predicted nucleic acid-binding protein